MRTAAIIVAAGKSRRFSHKVRKQFANLKGKPVFLWSVEAFSKISAVKQIILVLPKEDMLKYNNLAKKSGLTIVAGGRERHDSVKAGLKAVKNDIDYVAIHDGARPLIRKEIIVNALRLAEKHGASVVAVPAKETIKVSVDGIKVNTTIPRDTVWLAQTPQVFRLAIINEAYASLRVKFVTDDAQVLELYGKTACIVPGDNSNIKITEKADIETAEMLLGQR